MKRVVAALFFALLPVPGFAKEQLKKFRWSAMRPGHQRPQLAPNAAAFSPPVEARKNLLPGAGEFVERGGQLVGRAHVAGTWKQTIYGTDGQVTYAAGAEAENLPTIEGVNVSEAALSDGLAHALAEFEELRTASRVFPPALEVRQGEKGEWNPYWRVEYLAPAGDRLRYVFVSAKGEAIERGELDWDGVDGRAAVFPRGPQHGLREETLRDLTGDGTMTGRILQVVSALDLKVWSPQLLFFFPENDRRFDLGQAYFTVDQGFRWLRERLGIALEHPVSVRLHVGDGGVSNAAFYHQNTIYLGTGDGQVYKDMIRDPSILTHEAIHAVIDAYVGLPSEGEGGAFNEGFADLFAALILENPRMAEASYQKGPFRRTLENNLIAYRDFAPGVYQNGSIVGATFWDMKPELGTELTAKLAFRTLVRLGKGGVFDDLPSALASACDGLLAPEQKETVLAKARARGWKVP